MDNKNRDYRITKEGILYIASYLDSCKMKLFYHDPEGGGDWLVFEGNEDEAIAIDLSETTIQLIRNGRKTKFRIIKDVLCADGYVHIGIQSYKKIWQADEGRGIFSELLQALLRCEARAEDVIIGADLLAEEDKAYSGIEDDLPDKLIRTIDRANGPVDLPPTEPF